MCFQSWICSQNRRFYFSFVGDATGDIYNSNKPRTKTAVPRLDTAPYGVETSTPLIADWLRLMKPARPGEDRFPSPNQK